MPLPLPEGKSILIQHRMMENTMGMPSLEVAEDHYALNLIIKGYRRIITPTMSYLLAPGDINMMPPFLYHQAVPASGGIYESILVKFSPDFVSPITERFGAQILDQIFAHTYGHFEEATQEEIIHRFEELYALQEKESLYRDYYLQNALCSLLLFLLEHKVTSSEVNLHTSPLSEAIMDAIYYMESNYGKNLKIEEVARISGYSTAYFSRLFEEQLGCSYSEYLTNIRLLHIKSLLLSSNLSITEIALETGYTYPGNMSSVFRQHTGMSPLAYRKAARR